MSEAEILRAELARIAARLEQLAPAPAAPAPVAAPVAPEPRPVRVATLVGAADLGYLHRDVREVRRMVEAVAVCQGAPSPSQTLPASWVPQLRRLAASRATGQPWRSALASAGLEVPKDFTVQKRVVRRELSDLWDQVLAVAGLAVSDLNDTAKDQLLIFLRRLLA